MQVKNYFNTAGFDRWRRIYGETDDVNSVQRDIREGHAQTVEKVGGKEVEPLFDCAAVHIHVAMCWNHYERIT